jgi:hypothetical protein
MSMGIFMHNQPQPVVWLHPTYVKQKRDGIGKKIAKTINPKRLR